MRDGPADSHVLHTYPVPYRQNFDAPARVWHHRPTTLRQGSTASLSARGRVALDIGLFVAIVITAHPAWTGIGLHEWLAVVIVLPALYHLVINWDWVVRWSSKLMAKLKAGSRVNFVVDVGLFIATVAVMVTGIMVLPGAVPTAEGTVILGVWRDAHRLSSDATILLMLAHFLLHAEWMSDALTRSLTPKPGRHARGRAGTHATAAVRGRGAR